MKLLVVTQTVNIEDLVLGFFHEWIRALASSYESIEVICLYEGKHHLPENVHVHSLGKEDGRVSFFTYAIRFKKLAWKLRRNYDAVFAHMNQEYILIAGPLWKLLGKRIYMWRNHYNGSWVTDVAAAFCTKVFCTSAHSYTANYKNTVLMPVGIDTESFSTASLSSRTPHSILFLARMAPSKRVEVFIDALALVKEKGIPFAASLYGSPLPADEAYYVSLKERAVKLGLGDAVTFHPGVSKANTPVIYSAYEIFVNCSRSGMFDKTLFEAAACGCLVIASSEDFKLLAGDEAYFDGTPDALAERLETMLSMSAEAKEQRTQNLQNVAQDQSIQKLTARLVEAMR
jgi:glycosyltransferase involved in cell wall biosynthesis